MSFCPSCGTQTTSQAAFCTKCGAPSASSQNESTPQPSLKSSLKENKEALNLANQVVLAFLWSFLCEFKGYDRVFVQENAVFFIAFGLVLMAITYFSVVVKGVKEAKENFVLIPAILLAVLMVLGLVVAEDLASNNFYDWLSDIIGVIQVLVLIRVYTLVKASH